MSNPQSSNMNQSKNMNQSSPPLSSDSNSTQQVHSKSKNAQFFFLIIFITAILSGGGIYLWQRASLQNIELEYQKQVQLLEKQALDLRNQVQEVETRENAQQKMVDHNDQDQVTDNEIQLKNLIISEGSAYGMIIATNVFEDGSFLKIDQTSGWRPDYEDDLQCYQGKLTPNEHASLLTFIENQNFFNLRITQEHDFQLVCEGASSLEVRHDGQANSLIVPCVAELQEKTIQASSAINEINSKFNELADGKLAPCQQGSYLKTSSAGSCEELAARHLEWYDKELPIRQVDELSELLPEHQESFKNMEAFVYLGTVNDDLAALDGKYYSLSGLCYRTSLYQFQDNKFKRFSERD